MVEVKGKRGRKVPVLLTKEVKSALSVLIEKRAEVGVHPENPYLFPTIGHLRPWECLRKIEFEASWNYTKNVIPGKRFTESLNLTKYVTARCKQSIIISEKQFDLTLV